MKFVMSLVLAATFATPAFASDAEVKAIKQMGELKERMSTKKEVIDITQYLSEEEKEKMNSHRVTELKDPNAESGRNEKSWSVTPWTGGMRGRVLTPVEREREEREGKNTTYMGSKVGIDSTTSGGLKLKIKFGARQ